MPATCGAHGGHTLRIYAIYPGAEAFILIYCVSILGSLFSTKAQQCHGTSTSRRCMGVAGLPFGTGSARHCPCSPQHSSCHPHSQEQLNPAPCQLHSCHPALGGGAYETMLHSDRSPICWGMHSGLSAATCSCMLWQSTGLAAHDIRQIDPQGTSPLRRRITTSTQPSACQWALS